MTRKRPSREALSRRFAWFATEFFTHHSPLYGRLAAGIAEEPELLDLAARATSGPEPNLFLSAVHSLLLGGAEGAVARFYPSLSGRVPDGEDPYGPFRSFCLEHAEEIGRIVSTRRVQTNEVRRCAVLLPAFGLIARRANNPLALVEVGASAGLNLLFDRYAYDYGAGRAAGDADSPVRISCEARGDNEVPLPRHPPGVVCRVGLDLNPLDVRDPASARWLEALIWPEEYAHRAPLLRAALALARRAPPTLLRGDALDLLPEVLADVPVGATTCVFHTFTLSQFPEQARERFDELLRERARGRDLYRVSVEWLGADDAPLLRLVAHENGEEKAALLARCDDHGEWVEWLGPASRTPPS